MTRQTVTRTACLSVSLGLALAAACGRDDSPPSGGPAGKPKEEDTRLLETSAQALQSFAPVSAVDTYLDAFHALKDDPSHAVEVHHFCRARNEEFTQCVMFDANTTEANLVGVEYIISERLFESLPEDEQRSWHPHNYEILSGQMVAPGLPALAERAVLEKKLNTYGKTWHTWDTATDAGKTLPLGPARLGWSFNADGELPKELASERDKRMNVDVASLRAARQDLAPQAHPQRGVHALSSAFPGRSVPGYVKDRTE
ncbi:MAG: OBAP family protein [Polyangiales bacterium]